MSTSRNFSLLPILALGGLCACQAHQSLAGDPPRQNAPARLFPRALVEPKMVTDAEAFEARLAPHAEVLAADGTPWWTLTPGSSKVLLVAGHATAQTREGEKKVADGGTGSLAWLLSQLTGSAALATTFMSPSDPNYADDNTFKRELERLLAETHPALVLDLHASNPSRPYDVDFGTMEGASLLDHPDVLRDLADALRLEGLGNFSQDRFAASKNATVTKFVAARGVPVMQLEINATWLLPTPPTAACATPCVDTALQRQRFAQLVEGLVRFICARDRTEACVVTLAGGRSK